MALPDIKDAGILAGFTRWGWPWHGLCEGGVIGSSGKTITQPNGGNAWLIDKGLPALDISPELAASELAAGREWRNYALISGGQVYGKWLPRVLVHGYYRPKAYIHVDDDGINWMVTVGYSFPATNTVRITLSIVRFGHFEQGVGEQSPVTMFADVACEDITYISKFRWLDLQDVWTNGSKALACVFMDMDEDGLHCSILSAIEIVLSGSGGADGSALVLSAYEVKARSALMDDVNVESSDPDGSIFSGVTTDTNEHVYGYDPDAEEYCYAWTAPSTKEIRWEGRQGFIAGYPLKNGYEYGKDRCRICLYESDGSIAAYKLRYRKTIDNVVTNIVDTGRTGTLSCSSGGTRLEHIVTVTVTGTQREGYYLLKNDAIIDKMEHVRIFSGTQEQLSFYDGNYPPTYQDYYITYPVPYAAVSSSWEGSLSADIPWAAYWPYSGIYPAHDMIGSWDTVSPITGGFILLDDSVTKVGVLRTENIASFFVLDTARTYGTVVTPVGNKTTTETGGISFSWQRKTGDFAFSANHICYV